MHIRIRGECTLVVREPPAGPKKIDFRLTRSTFSKILSILESRKKSLPHCGYLSRDRIEATNAFLDRSWHTLVRKIAPVSNEFTNSEISSFLWPIFQLLSLTNLKRVVNRQPGLPPGMTCRASPARVSNQAAFAYHKSSSCRGQKWTPNEATLLK